MTVVVSPWSSHSRITPPQLDQPEQAAFIEKARELAPKYRTELLQPKL